ncbi:hypothetical protein Ptr902_12914 [Pyrenophora tritici-repentis]|nr:hypothetical protein Ptr902_12914 [Pyrenophora tritici-repentis]
MLWHKRLGHLRLSAIEHLIQQSKGSKRQIRRALRLNDEGPRERIAIDFYKYEADSFTKEKS